MSRWLCILAITAQAAVWGQTQAASNFGPTVTKQGGVHLEGVSVYSGYYSSGGVVTFDLPQQNPFLGATGTVGVAATIGGSKSGEKGSFNWSYSPSYFRLVYSERGNDRRGSLNHRGNLNWNRKLSGKWSMTANASAFVANFEQLYFNPSTLTSVASMSVTFDDLAAGMLRGQFTDAHLASLLTGAPLAQSPEQGFLYGSRMFSGSAGTGFVWEKSRRTSVSFNLSGSRSQHVNATGAPVSSVRFFIPQMTTVTAGVGWAYSLSPRTQIGANVYATRTFSRLQQGYISGATMSLGRTLSRRWFVRGSGGFGTITYSRQAYTNPRLLQYVFSGSIGYKTTAHTLVATYDRSLGDMYGLGSSNTATAFAAWNWRRPGSSWTVSAGGGYQELKNAVFSNTRSWRANAGVARSLSRNFFFGAQYIYAEFPADLRSTGLEQSQNGFSVSLTWSPASRYP